MEIPWLFSSQQSSHYGLRWVVMDPAMAFGANMEQVLYRMLSASGSRQYVVWMLGDMHATIVMHLKNLTPSTAPFFDRNKHIYRDEPQLPTPRVLRYRRKRLPVWLTLERCSFHRIPFSASSEITATMVQSHISPPTFDSSSMFLLLNNSSSKHG